VTYSVHFNRNHITSKRSTHYGCAQLRSASD
jgi:hypothetical protein